MPEGLPVGHEGHGHVFVTPILHELPHRVRNLRKLCKQFFALAPDGFDPPERGVGSGGMPEDERRFELLRIVAGGDGVEIDLGKALRTAL